MIDEVNKLSGIVEKLSYIKENIDKDNIKDIIFILGTPEFTRYIQFIVNKGRKNMKDFAEEEYLPISNLVFILQSVYNYGEDESPIRDEDYDILYEILENKDIEIITTPVLKNEVVHHKYTNLRGTLEKIYALDDEEKLANESRKRLSDWVKRSENEIKNKTGKDVNLWNEEIYLFPKWDGVSIIFEINENNEIERALTRGNVEMNEAEDVTFIFKSIESEIVCDYMKGKRYGLKTEVMMHEEDFNKYNETYNTNFKSSRSIVSSIINTDKIDGREKLLQIQKLRIAEFHDGEESIEVLTQEVFEDPLIRCQLKDIEAIKKFSFNHKYTNDLRCDGSVIYIINPELQKILGRENSKNKFEVAYKFNEEFEYTKLKDIIFQMGTFGTINPVAIVEPVKIKGNEIKRVSLGSMYRFWDLKLSKGDIVKVNYEIIPYLTFDPNDKKCKKSKNKPIDSPSHCPECGEELTYSISDDGKPVLPKCTNPECKFLKKKKIVNYIQKMNMQGISYETISDLFDSKIVKSIKDLYRLKDKWKKIKELPGFSDGKVNILKTEIETHRTVDDATLLGSIGIAHASKKVFQKILKLYSIEDLVDFADAENYEPLTDIQGIKNAKAKIVINGIRENRSLIIFLMDELDIRCCGEQTCRFKACFSKIRSTEITNLIVKNGGIVEDSLTKDTSFLIVPNLNVTSSTIEKAKKYNIDIVPINLVKEYLKQNFRI